MSASAARIASATWPKSIDAPPYQMLKLITRSSTEPGGRSAAGSDPPPQPATPVAKQVARSAIARRTGSSSQR